MNKELMIAWAAGLFEGEGCFFVNRIVKNGVERRYACATLRMTDQDVVEKFAAVVGVGKIFPKKAAKAQESWDWRAHGVANTTLIYNMFKPYLGTRRLALGQWCLSNEEHKAVTETQHGTRSKYRKGCRCEDCKRSNTLRIRKNREKKRSRNPTK